MKNLALNWVAEPARYLAQSMVKRACVALLGAICFVTMLAPTTTPASGSAMTQMEYLKWLVQLSGDGGQFTSHSTANDYVQWAQVIGVNPNGGWNVNAALTRDMLAQTLAQLLNLKPGKSTDYVKLLLREGIVIPSDNVITRWSFVSVVDDIGFKGRTPNIGKMKHSKHKTPTKHPSHQKVPTPRKAPTPHNGKH